MSTSLWISDASPLFFYSPSDVYFSGLGLGSWSGSDSGGNADATAGSSSSSVSSAVGSGGPSSSHSTVGNAALILPEIYATAFAPVFTSSSSYNTTLKAGGSTSPWTSEQNWTASSDSGFSAQTFELDFECLASSSGTGAGTCTDEAVFAGAWVETELAPSGSVVQSVTLDDASSLLTYTGFAPLNSTATATDGSSQSQISVSSSDDYEGTLSLTSTNGATAQATFLGASISLQGVVCPTCGSYTISLDGTQVASLSSANNATIHDVLLYFGTNLDTSSGHTLLVTAVGDGQVILDSFTIYGPQGGVGFTGTINGVSTTLTPTATATATGTGTGTTSTATSTASGTGATTGGSTNAGVIVGAILGTLAGLGLLGYLVRRIAPAMKKAEEKKLNPWDEANLLQNMKNEEVHVTTVADQRYVYPGLIAHSDLKKK